MRKLKRGDTVEVIKGKDRGKKGKIMKVFWETGRVVVEGINLVKKHRRQTRQDQKGGIVSIEASINACNLMLVCKSCNKPVRASFALLKDGTKNRTCSACNEAI